jgi:hypothetical membrane protein
LSAGNDTAHRLSSRLPWLAAAGVVIYVAVDISLAVLRPDLSLLHQAESDYGVGPYSWLMDLNFILRGVLSLALVWTLVRLARPSAWVTMGLVLLAAWAVGSATLAFFPDNPPGTVATVSGHVHLVVAELAFVCAAVSTVMLSVNWSSLPGLEAVRGRLLVVSLLAVLPLLLLGRSGFASHSLGGLYERVFLGLGLLWIFLAALQLARSTSPNPDAGVQPAIAARPR